MELSCAAADKKLNGGLKDTTDHRSRDLYISKVDDESKNCPEQTIVEVLTLRAEDSPNLIILKSKSDPNKTFDLSISMKEYVDLIRKAAKSFIKLGLDPKGAVGLIGFNHAAWCISQFGCIFAGGIICGIYTTNNADVCKYIMNDCCCQVMVVENTAQLTKVLSIVDQCPQVKAIIQYTGTISNEYKDGTTIPIYTWNEFMDLDTEEENAILESRIKVMMPRDVAILIYTSGTTGLPKGVMLSHDNILWACKMAIISTNMTGQGHSIISYLPLSHVAANLVDIFAPIILGVTVYFAQPDALKGSLGKTLKEVRPTIFLGVPRVFEKIQEQIQEIGSKSRGIRKSIAIWAKKTGYRNNLAKQAGKSTNFSYQIAKCLVFVKVRKALGLDRCTYVLSGAAPLARHTLEFFMSLDIIVHQVYGMSESSGPHSLGYPDSIKLGSAGTLMRGSETKIINPDENGIGEICLKGRHIFLGYYKSEEKTREVLDKDGWLHSGDLGKVEDKEFLRITGRIKEIIITAGGENIAPVPIEDQIKEKLPFVGNAILIGDRKKFVTCLLTLKTAVDPDTQIPMNTLIPGAIRSLQGIGIESTTIEDVFNCKDSILESKIDETIKEINKTSISRAAFIQKWSFLPKDFSIHGGELGPTMKLKRSVITDMYVDIIDKMYA